MRQSLVLGGNLRAHQVPQSPPSKPPLNTFKTIRLRKHHSTTVQLPSQSKNLIERLHSTAPNQTPGAAKDAFLRRKNDLYGCLPVSRKPNAFVQETNEMKSDHKTTRKHLETITKPPPPPPSQIKKLRPTANGWATSSDHGPTITDGAVGLLVILAPEGSVQVQVPPTREPPQRKQKGRLLDGST